jgi:hypothetical protein
VRERNEIECLLSHAYGKGFVADRLMPGLTTVAAALNANDQGLARIAAVHLQIPDLPDQAARDAMEVADVLIKYARDEGGGGSNWNPALHPRAGTPPNPGWFSPTEGDESSSTRTAQNDDPMPRQARARIGFDCDPDRNASTSLQTSPSGSPTQRPRMRRRSARKSKDTTQMSAGMRRLTISMPN